MPSRRKRCFTWREVFRMNRTLTRIIALALTIAAIASILVYRLVRSKLTDNGPSASARIVVATKKLDTGVVVKDADLKVSNWVGEVPKGFSASTKDLVGRGVTTPIYEGE